MYRCFACDAPAQPPMNCVCHTQLEAPQPTKVAPVTQKINVASGEDAGLDSHTYYKESA